MQIVGELRPLALARLRRIEAPAWLGPFGREPWIVLAPLLVAQSAAAVALAFSVNHDGWLYYQGGDQTYYYTTSWLLAHWTLPPTPIGYGWSYLLAPIALFAGPNVLSALPAIVILNAGILLPVALLCMYGIGARLGGRLVGYLAALLWLVVPYAAIPLFIQRFHEKYVDLTLPQTLGFSGLADFPSTVCLLLAAYLVLRALDRLDWRDALLAGLVTGFALGMKPSNGLFVFGPVLALAAARRFRQLVVYGAAMAPALLTLALWKERGLGQLPAFSGLGRAGPAIAATLPVFSLNPLRHYVHIDWSVMRQNLDVLREVFWSVRALEWIPLAGALALARRSVPKALLVAGWFAAFIVVKGTDPRARVEDASFFRLLMPSLPAFVLLLAAVPLLVPTVGGALVSRFPPREPDPRRLRLAIPVAVAVLVLLPLPLVLGPSLQREAKAVVYYDEGVFVPVVDRFQLTAVSRNGRVELSWVDPYHGRSGIFYTVFRSPPTQPDPDDVENPPVREGVNCRSVSNRPGASECRILMARLGSTPAKTWSDRPGAGRWSYRVALSANWLNDPTQGDVVVVSEPVTLAVSG